jgi:kynurenine formamidase
LQLQLLHNNITYTVDTLLPINIAIPLQSGAGNPNCFYAAAPSFVPVKTDTFIGDTQQGGVVNFFDVQYNPHGNGTHTECVGHIATERYSINDCLKESLVIAQLITITPEQNGTDKVICKQQIENANIQNGCSALIIRTLPNVDSKLHKNYSGQNPPYIAADAMQSIVEAGIEHLIVDLPSVDREEDDGVLAAHHIFWNYNTGINSVRKYATITEMAYIPNQVADGLYLLNIQVMPIQLDASSSRLILYKINNT